MRLLSLILVSTLVWVVPAYANQGSNEGAGLISNARNGALPKTLWVDQKRSEIIKGIRSLANTSELDSVQQIKRNLLLSSYDVDDIKNDIPANESNNLLAIRLEKLAQMGLSGDALKLYNKAVNAPEDNETLARIGVTLTLVEKGLSTACLDAKVLKPYFSGAYWDQINAVCNAELYGDKPISTQLGDSAILKALYFEPDFTIPADNITSLDRMSLFELAVTFNKGRVEYKNADLSQISTDTPLKIINFFKKDKNAPEELKTILTESQEVISDEEEFKATQSALTSTISAKLRANKALTESDFQQLLDFAELHPENYFFLAILGSTEKKYGNYITPEDKINLGVEKLSNKYGNKVKLLHSLLDNEVEFSNNQRDAYEKQIVILLPNVLNELNLIYSVRPENMDNTGDKSLEKTNTPLNRLGKVGLIQQAHLIAREILADLMQSNI